MYKSEFDCPAQRGVGCMALSNVNDALDAGTLDQYISGDEADEKYKGDKNSKSEVGILDNQETTIWFKEYKDDKGKVHKDHEIKL